MVQQVLATRSVRSSAESGPPVSPSRSGVTSRSRKAATSRRAASRPGATDRLSGSMSSSSDSSRLWLRGWRHSSRKVTWTDAGMGPRSCFRFTTGPGPARPRRRPSMASAKISPTAPFTRAGSFAGLAPSPQSSSIASSGFITGTGSGVSRVSGSPGSGVGGGRPVLQVRQAPGPPLPVGRHHVVAAGRRLRRCGSFFSGRGHALVSTPIAGSRFGGCLGTGLHLGPRLLVLVAGRREDQRHAPVIGGAGVRRRSLVFVLHHDLLHHSPSRIPVPVRDRPLVVGRARVNAPSPNLYPGRRRRRRRASSPYWRRSTATARPALQACLAATASNGLLPSSARVWMLASWGQQHFDRGHGVARRRPVQVVRGPRRSDVQRGRAGA